jgi:hypothetical protein
VQLIMDCLLYFTSFGATFTLFASVVSIVVWVLKTLWLWVIAEPEPEPETSRSKRFRPQDLSYLKRAGQ